jgi:hypothetical protein
MRAKTRHPTEHQIQAAFVEWLHLGPHRNHPAIKAAFAIPNGGFRDKRTAAKLQAEGVRAGVPDFCIPLNPPIWIEFKKPGGKMSNSQKEMSALLSSQKQEVYVCTSVDQAIEKVNARLGIKFTPLTSVQDRIIKAWLGIGGRHYPSLNGILLNIEIFKALVEEWKDIQRFGSNIPSDNIHELSLQLPGKNRPLKVSHSPNFRGIGFIMESQDEKLE